MDSKFINKDKILELKRELLEGKYDPLDIKHYDAKTILSLAVDKGGADIPTLLDAMCETYKRIMFKPNDADASETMNSFLKFAKYVNRPEINRVAMIRQMEDILMVDAPVNYVTRIIFASMIPEANSRKLLLGIRDEYFERVGVSIQKKKNEESKPQYEYIAPKSK